jgi:hypothetical protein
MGRAATNGKFPFTHGIEHAELFANRTGSKALAVGTLAFEDFLEVEGHGTSLRSTKRSGPGSCIANLLFRFPVNSNSPGNAFAGRCASDPLLICSRQSSYSTADVS